MVLLSKEYLREELQRFAQESFRDELQDMEKRLKDAIHGIIISNAKKEPRAVDLRIPTQGDHSTPSPSLEDHFDKKDRKENEVKWITRGRRCSVADYPTMSSTLSVRAMKSNSTTSASATSAKKSLSGALVEGIPAGAESTNSALSKRGQGASNGRVTNFGFADSSKRFSASDRFSLGSNEVLGNELSLVYPSLEPQVSYGGLRESWAIGSMNAFAQPLTGSTALTAIEEDQLDRQVSNVEIGDCEQVESGLILETTGLLDDAENSDVTDTYNNDLWEVQRNPRMRHTLHHSHVKHSVLVEARSSMWKSNSQYGDDGEPPSTLETLQDFLGGNRFTMFSGMAIVLNIVMIGIETDYMARYWTQSVPQEFQYIDTAFCIYFLLEILLRCVAFGFAFFTNWWNLFDLLTVLLQVGEEVTSHLSEAHALHQALSAENIGIVRVMRIFRLIRVMRIIRLLSAFSALRMLVVSVVDSMRSLIWTMVLIFMTMFIISVYFTQIVTDHKVKNMADQEGEEPQLFVFYGTLDRTMLTLYQTISEGLHWDVAMEPLRSHCSPWMALVFSLYIAFVTFAMLNVITGVFVESAIQTANDDKKKVLMYQMRQVFSEADLDNSGTISWPEFEDQLQNPQLQSFLRVVDLDTEEAEDLFRLLDVNGENEISADEFVHGALRIHGFAKAIDLATFMHEFYRHARRVEKALDVIYSHVK